MNRTTGQYSIVQAAAGTFLVAPAQPGLRVYVTAIVIALGANGTFKFQEDTTDLTGPLPAGQNSPFIAISGTDDMAILHTTTPGRALNLVTSGGAANGWLRGYYAS